VKLGLPDTILYTRYGPWWETFLTALEIPLVKPTRPLEDSLEAGARLMPDEAPLMQLFVGRVMEIAQDAEALLIPDLNPGAEPGAKGSSADPWMVDLPSVLGQRFSLPPIYSVPTTINPTDTPAFAVRLGQALTGNSQRVRRVLDRTQSALRPARIVDPMWQIAGKKTVGVTGDPALLEQRFLIAPALKALEDAGFHPVLSTQLPRERTLEMGRRKQGKTTLETDLEFLGGAAMLEAKAQVKGLVVLTQPRSTMQSEFAAGVVKRAHKPALSLELESDYAALLQPWMLE
jgi:CoA enzyme activase uncharacterised domain (DUF2229)